MSDISQAGLPDATTASLTDKATGLQGGASKNLSLGLVKQLFDTPVINPQSADYTLNDNDHGTMVEIDSNSPATVTIPNTLRVKFTCIVVQKGTGLVSIVGGSGVNTRGGSALNGQNAMAAVIGRALNDFYILTGGGSSSGSTRLATPSVTATVISSTEIDLSWSAITGANQYVVKRNTSNTISGATTVHTGSGTSFNDTGLTAGTTYYYFVVAQDTTAIYSDSLAGTASGTTSSGTTYQDIPFTSNAQVTNTAQVLMPGGSAASGWDNLVLSSKTLAGDGYVDFIRQSDSDNAMLGLCTSNSITTRAGINAGAVIPNNGTVYYQDAPSGGGSPTTAGGAVSNGDRVRIKRAGSLITLLTVSGGTETLINTYTFSTTALLYIWVAVFSPAGKLYTPKGFGIS